MSGAWARVALHWVAVPLRAPFGAAHGTEEVREVVLVEAQAVDGVTGWGECDALARPTYTHEYTAGAFAVLRDVLAPAWLAGQRLASPWHPMAAAALEAASLDAAAQRQGVSLATMLGGGRRSVARTVVIGGGRSVDELVAAVAAAHDGGAALVKLKLATAADRDGAAAVRAALPDVALAADANGSFAGYGAAELRWVDALGLAYLEQPHPADDLLAAAALRAELATPIALDESVTSLGAARAAHALRAFDVVNVKPARLGGLLAAVDVARWAAGEGLGVFCGGMLELGVGRAAAAALAALDPFGLPTDLGPSRQYVARDLTDELVVDPAGQLELPTGPGIGVRPDPDRLAAATVRSVTLRP